MVSLRSCSPISQRNIQLGNASPDEIPLLRTPELLEIIIQEPQLPAVYASTRLTISASKRPSNLIQRRRSSLLYGAIALIVISPKNRSSNTSLKSLTSVVSPPTTPFSSYAEPVKDEMLVTPFTPSKIWDRLSDFQKGFRENEGCVEHNFLLDQAIVEATRSKSYLALAWLDLENAFDSIPHSFTIKSLEAIGVPDSTLKIIISLYTGASSEIRCSRASSSPIPMEARVRQDCLLSAILFNLSLEQVLRLALEVDTSGFPLFGQPLRCLAYADGLIILDRTNESLQLLIDSACDLATSIGLRFNPPKCASIAFHHSRGRRSVDGTALRVSGSAIPSLTAAKNIVSIRDSLLAPWQKLHAIRSIILPHLDFACRNVLTQNSQTVRLDKLLIATTKKILNLPDRANTALVHLSCHKGGAAMPRFRDLLDVYTIGHAFRSLSSPDAIVSDVALKSLESVVRKKICSAPDLFALVDYLNGSNSGPLARDAGDFSTVWSRTRHAAQTREANSLRVG
ncbi:retrovirus-related Pol polyprotein from type-2 retrotransposable element R2DM [Trichonephila clavipes]|nr:retrovirus-related Pol polyprotein from type-2 retrotransposable element R2DM [Trichonephila clavipes]